ncbi:hypothetical protein [Altibacter sp. HG106]|uniref:hypothetical protein n=1 Tax=Altibacter sp. HG106 TaxID=3023937 RepID=UPI002350FD15|nr:hypothetical protein [Altibacter sp. HG106]MDC7993970.1 hypothetical protein [Altibacter sp. HG106]
MLLKILFPVFLLSISFATAQVGIGTTTPDPSAALDVEATDAGLLIPRVSLNNVTDGTTPIDSPATGLLIYNTNASVVGGDGEGYYHWDGAWEKLLTAATSEFWSTSGNAGTNPATDYIGTSDAQPLVFGTDNTEQARITASGNVGIGENNPTNKLQVDGSILFEGDFINQEVLGVHNATTQSIPFTNGVLTPLTGTTVSITIPDGSGVDHSSLLLTGFARVFGGNLNGTSNSLGGYFIILQRDTDPLFSGPVNLTYTSGICYIETPNGATSASIGFGGGGHISFVDSSLTAGTTYYYRLTFFTNGVGITNGNYQVFQRDLNLLQIKR